MRRLQPRIAIRHPAIGEPREPDYHKEFERRLDAKLHEQYDRGFVDGQRAARLKRLQAGLVDAAEKEELIAPPRTYPRILGFD